MPKILIKEIDNTSPGTPGSYANYSVLIAGYKGTPSTKADAKIVQPDSNGVYEFSSRQAFEDTIGVTKDEKDNGVSITSSDTATDYHYGKRMAYELLNLGYTVIYAPIESVTELADESFWEIFKDKASYDFRFVSHGLLETTGNAADYEALTEINNYVKASIKALEEIKTAAESVTGFAEKSEDDKKAEYVKAYKAVIETKGNEKLFRDPSTFDKAAAIYFGENKYDSAVANYGPDADGKIAAQNEIEGMLAIYDNDNISIGTLNGANGCIAKLASYRTVDGVTMCDGRGDCVALIELDERSYYDSAMSVIKKPEVLIVNGINDMSASIGEEGAYCALTVPSVYYKMGKDPVKFPGAFHYLACFMSSLSSGFAEWYAAAGYTRGVSSYVVDHTTVKLGEIAINALEPRNLVDDPSKVQPAFASNVIANFRGSYYLWGNRTASKLTSAAGGGDLVAQHFLNIRQLCATIKKQLYVACRRFTFDPNSDTLWFNFVNAITPTLDSMKSDQGIRDYKVIKVYTDKKATLKAKIRIIPIEAVEDFDLEISLEDSFGETSAVVTE